MGLSQKDKVPKQRKCHCEPVRRLVWQSPPIFEQLRPKIGGFVSIREIATPVTSVTGSQ